MSSTSRSATGALAFGLACSMASAAAAVPGYTVRTVALEGAPAPGTADQYGAFLDVAINASGEVAFGAPLASGFPAGGVWVDSGAGAALRVRDGDAAPAPQSGTFLAFGSFTRLDAAGNVGVAAILSTGIDGAFLDSGGGSRSVLVAEGDAAPVPPGGSFDGGIGDVGMFTMNPGGDIAFRSNVTGGTQSPGVFVRTAGAATTLLVGNGDAPSGGGPDTFTSFGYPAIAPGGGAVAFAAQLTGGAATTGLFADSGSGADTLALDGDAAPDTGGGSFVDFLYPAVNAGGDVVFLSNVTGGAATGGLFVASPAVSSIAVEHQSVPGAGPISTLANIPTIASDGSVAMSLGFASGPVSGGVYLHAAGSGFSPVVLAGEAAPDSGGASFASFGFLGQNDAGEVAFVATLDDARSGVFVATPDGGGGGGAPKVPALPIAALPVLALLLLASAPRLRRASH